MSSHELPWSTMKYYGWSWTTILFHSFGDGNKDVGSENNLNTVFRQIKTRWARRQTRNPYPCPILMTFTVGTHEYHNIRAWKFRGAFIQAGMFIRQNTVHISAMLNLFVVGTVPFLRDYPSAYQRITRRADEVSQLNLSGKCMHLASSLQPNLLKEQIKTVQYG